MRVRGTGTALRGARGMCAAMLALTVVGGGLPSAVPVMAQETAAPSEPALPPPATAPTPLFPPDGASFQTWAEIPAFTWDPAVDATEYQVVINGGERTGPWLTRTKWSPGDLGAGTWTWQVTGRTNGGVGPASPVLTFTVASGAAPAPEPAAPLPADTAAPPAAPDASAGPAISLGAAGPIEVGQQLGMTGAGFQPSEAIEVRWLGDQGPVVATQTADESGAFSLTLEVPQTPIGDRPVVAVGTATGAQAIGWFTITPSILEGPADGERVPVALLGFSPQETATVYRDAEGGEALGSGVTDANGTALVDITVPAGSGPLKVYAAGEASGGLAWETLGDEAPAAPEAAEAAPEPAPAQTPVPAVAPQPTPAATVVVPPPVVAGGWAPTPTMSPEDQAKRDEANAVRARLGLPPLAPGVIPTSGNESAGAASDGITVDSATTQRYQGTSGGSAPEPIEESQQAASAEPAPAAASDPTGDPTMLQPWQGSADGEPVAVPGGIYNRIEDPEAYNVVPAEKRPNREEKDRKDRERRGDAAADPAEDAPPAATPEPSNDSGRERDPGHAAAPGTLLGFAPVADTSVGSAEPDAAQPETQRSVLPLGGPETATTFVTFDVSGLGGAKVASATLTVTGAIGFWGPVSVGVLPGYWVNENGLTWNTAPDWDAPAVDASGDAAGFPELPADGVVTVDVTGSVQGDGAITFVLRGTPDTGQAIGSRESAIPARLEVVAG